MKFKKDYWHHSQIGLTFILIFGVFFYAGLRLDARYNTQPVFLFCGFTLGFVCAVLYLYQELFQKKQ